MQCPSSLTDSHLLRLTVILFGLAVPAPGHGESPAELPPAPAADDLPRVFVEAGVRDEFDAVRGAIAAAKTESDRDYRVVIVKNADDSAGAAALLQKLVARWREEGGEAGGFNPAADVTIVLDVGDRTLAMDVPWSVEATAGLDPATLEQELISKVFIPRAKDGLYDEGLAELVRGTERWITDRRTASVHRAEAARIFRTRTLPISAAAVAGVGLLGWLLVRWVRHGNRLREARARLATFKADVVALSDLLDAQQ